MVTIRPIPKTEVRCNACNVVIGHIERTVFTTFEPDKSTGDTFMRLRIYDIKDDGEPLNKNEFEVDFCEKCTEKFGKIMKKFGLTKSKVPRGLTSSAIYTVNTNEGDGKGKVNKDA